jgi:hypothetical protein
MSDQELAIRCAYADLIKVFQAHRQGTLHQYDWAQPERTIEDLRAAFPQYDLGSMRTTTYP